MRIDGSASVYCKKSFSSCISAPADVTVLACLKFSLTTFASLFLLPCRLQLLAQSTSCLQIPCCFPAQLSWYVPNCLFLCLCLTLSWLHCLQFVCLSTYVLLFFCLYFCQSNRANTRANSHRGHMPVLKMDWGKRWHLSVSVLCLGPGLSLALPASRSKL